MLRSRAQRRAPLTDTCKKWRWSNSARFLWRRLSDDDDRVGVHDRRGYLYFVETSYHFCTQCSVRTVMTVCTETLFSYDCDLSDWGTVQSRGWLQTFRTNLLLFSCTSVECYYHISLSPIIYHYRLVELSSKTSTCSNSVLSRPNFVNEFILTRNSGHLLLNLL